MAASTQATAGADIACPDPSRHSELSKDPELQDQASKAAQLATGSEKISTTSKRGTAVSLLGPDGKLSAAGAATSLKYAKPRDLPGYPTVGIDTTTSGQKAATLANRNQSSFEHWKPDASASASKAALAATKDGGKLNLWQPEASKEGFAAAGTALKSDQNLSPKLDYGYTDVGKRNSLLAATKSISGSTKPPPEPSPKPKETYPDAHNSAYNALNAATVAHKPSVKTPGDSDRWGSEAMEASRFTHNRMSREMFTEHPPVALEVEDKRHQEALRASAVVMAKQMMEEQKRRSAEMQAKSGAGDIAAKTVHSKHISMFSDASEDHKAQASQYVNLEEAARKLAAERLAKLDPDGVAAYREHYGYGLHSPPRSRLKARGLGRRRSSSDGDGEEADSSSDDEFRAGRIRHQMSTFNKAVESVDEKKKQQDRENLMAVAQKRVQARLKGMDEKVFAETGQVSPALLEDWEAKAKAKAAAESEKRMEHHGKVHIGGGKYMHQADIDAIAQARMQPTLDEISDTAEKKRARDEEIRLDTERKKAEAEAEKQQQAELKAELKQNERNEKFRLAQEKREQKAAEKEEKRQKKANRSLFVAQGESPLLPTEAGGTDPPAEEAGTEAVAKDDEELEETKDEPKAETHDGEEAEEDSKFEPLALTEAEEPTAGTTASAAEASNDTSAAVAATPSTPARAGSKIKGFFGRFRSTKSPEKGAAPETPSDAAPSQIPTEEKSSDAAELLKSSETDQKSELYESSEKGVPTAEAEHEEKPEVENATEPEHDDEPKDAGAEVEHHEEPTAPEAEPEPEPKPEPELEPEPEQVQEHSPSPPISLMKDEEDATAVDPEVRASTDDYEEARDTFDEEPEAPKSSIAETESTAGKSGSKFKEEME